LQITLVIIENDVCIGKYQPFILAFVIETKQHVLNDIDAGRLFVVSPDNSPRRGQMMGSGKFFGLRPHFLSQALLVGYFEKLICGDTSEPDPINCRPH